MGRGAFIVGLALALCALSAFAGNRHEHLHALASPAALESAYQEWATGRAGVPATLGGQPAAEMVRDPAAAIRDIFGPEALARTAAALGIPADAKREAFVAALGNRTLDELSALVQRANVGADARFRDARAVALSWFAFTSVSQRDPNAYQRMEDIRRENLTRLFDRHGPEEFGKFWKLAVERTGREIPYQERSILDLSVPKRLFHPEVYNATVRGSYARVSFLLSLPRGQLFSMKDAEFADELELAKRAVREGWGHGIDITGSIQESREISLGVETLQQQVELLEATMKGHNIKADRLNNQALDLERAGKADEARALRDEAAQERRLADEAKRALGERKRERDAAKSRADKFEKRLDQVFKAMAEVKGEVRIHAFEGGREGPFYTALRRAIEKPGPRPYKIRIGHAAAMNEADVKWLGEICKDRGMKGVLTVEVNPESNFALHGTDPKSLLKTLIALEVAGVPTVLGADEQGILGRTAGLNEMLLKLREQGAPEGLLIKLAARSAGIPDSSLTGITRFEQVFGARCLVWFRNLGAGGQLVPRPRPAIPSSVPVPP